VSLIPADDFTYLDLVGEAFLAERGQGLVLSPVDVELVRHYEGAGVPPHVLVLGIARACERRRYHGKPPPASLSACKRTLDAEVRKHLAGRAGSLRQEGPFAEAGTLDRLIAATREATDPAERAAYASAYRAACAGLAIPEAAGLGYLRHLPRLDQRLLAQAVHATLGRRLAPEPREEYRERLRRALVSAAIAQAKLAV